MPLEDQRPLSSYLPSLREFIPNAVEEIEADMLAHPKQEDYVYDLYTVKDDTDINVDDIDEDYYDGPDYSDYESDDSNAENSPLNGFPDEISQEEGEASESESEEREHGNASDESSEEDLRHQEFSKGRGTDALFDEDFDDYDGIGSYDVGDGRMKICGVDKVGFSFS